MNDIIFKEVHSDARRTIFANSDILKGKEISLINLNKLKAIGGCIHDKNEHCMLLSGTAILFLNDQCISMSLNESYIIPKDTPHAFVSLFEEAIIMEWGITEEEKKNNKKDKYLLNLINSLNNGI